MKNCWTHKKLAIAMLLLMTTSMTKADELSGHISGFIGLKSMNSSDWSNLNTHFSMGVIFDIKKESWPISITLNLMDTGSEYKHDGSKDLAHTTEYHFGISKTFQSHGSKIQPYIGGGVSFIYAELEYQTNSNTMTQDGRDVGVWLGTGMYYDINPEFLLGLDVRYSHGEVVLFNAERDVGGLSIGVTVGYQF